MDRSPLLVGASSSFYPHGVSVRQKRIEKNIDATLKSTDRFYSSYVSTTLGKATPAAKPDNVDTRQSMDEFYEL